MATAERRQRVLHHILRARKQGYQLVVVVSAMGRRGDPYATDTLIDLIRQANPSPSRRDLDLALSCGEILATVVISQMLQERGVPSVALTGAQAGITTDDGFGNARILEIHPQRVLAALERGEVAVVAGFQGITRGGDVTTLGRGGSDTSAVALGVALGAEMVEVYTDVEGVMTADPRLVNEACTLPEATYREVAEMAQMGAKVIHPRAVEIAMEGGIPLRVRSTFSDHPGTLITRGSPGGVEIKSDRVVTAIAHLGGLAYVRVYWLGGGAAGTVKVTKGVESPGPAAAEPAAGGAPDGTPGTAVPESEGFSRSRLSLALFQALAAAGISLDLIQVSPDRITFVVEEERLPDAAKVLAQLPVRVQAEPGYAKVTAVGGGMRGVPGVMARIVRALWQAGVPIYHTTDSHTNISCLVAASDVERAVHALHHEFGLDQLGGMARQTG